MYLRLADKLIFPVRKGDIDEKNPVTATKHASWYLYSPAKQQFGPCLANTQTRFNWT